jgi:hypothetical protein
MEAIIKFTSTTKFEDVDKHYTTLYRHIKENKVIDISLPTNLKNTLFLVPTIIQFVCTWVRYEKSGKLRLQVDTNISDEKIDEIFKNEIIFPLIGLVWNSNEVYTEDGKTNLRSVLKDKNNETIKKMRAVEVLKTNQLALTNFDHFDRGLGILPVFEQKDEFINEPDLLKSLQPAFKKILNFKQGFTPDSGWAIIYEDKIQEITAIIHELMKNTFEWARTDKYNVPLDPNIRGVSIKFHKYRRNTLLENFKGFKGVYDFFNSKTLKENPLSELYFLEISVYDSGIGFIDKYKKFNNTTPELSDIDIVKLCLIKNITIAKGLEKYDKGKGLDRILGILNFRGLLRIKTGSVAVYRNLISHNYKAVESGNYSNMELFDWQTSATDKFTSNPFAQGSVISIIYPLSVNG